MISPYTTVEILVWLILTALLGYFIGWLIRGARLRRRLADVETEEQELADEYEELLRELDDCRTQQASMAPVRTSVLTETAWEDEPVTSIVAPRVSVTKPRKRIVDLDPYEVPAPVIPAPKPRRRTIDYDLSTPRSRKRSTSFDEDLTTGSEYYSRDWWEDPSWSEPVRPTRTRTSPTWTPPERPARMKAWSAQHSDLDDAAIRRAREAARTRVARISKDTGATPDYDVEPTPVRRPARRMSTRSTSTSRTPAPRVTGTRASSVRATSSRTSLSSGTAKPTKHRYSQGEARSRVSAIAKRTAGSGPVLKDDLRDIHGVGDTLSKLLASMGITSFQQVARFTKSDVEMVEAALDCFPGRVTRDDWMGSAREQHILKYGKAPGRA
ncbi:MAG: hypothetical protein FWG08_07300 [Propionibacteriaceae bacterium]|nr:hypothetical protein [Propionibacteriaceae bacterium]